MGTFYWVTGILLGVSIGLGMALRFTVELIMRSNDIGDTTGNCVDFSSGIELCKKKEGRSKKKISKLYRSAEAVLQRRRNEVIRDAQLAKMQEGIKKLTRQQ